VLDVITLSMEAGTVFVLYGRDREAYYTVHGQNAEVLAVQVQYWGGAQEVAGGSRSANWRVSQVAAQAAMVPKGRGCVWRPFVMGQERVRRSETQCCAAYYCCCCFVRAPVVGGGA
jgi:hypothetical protein